jgi:hypothetical protein
MENVVNLIANALNVSIPDNGGYQSRYRTNNSPFDAYGSNISNAIDNTQVVVENGGDIGTLLGTQNFK